jgi:hypothetical protein
MDTAAMLLESAHRFLVPIPGLMPEDQEFNRSQMYRTFEH